MRWASIPYGDGRYEVSDTGLVRNSRTGKAIKDYASGSEGQYRGVMLSFRNRKKSVRIHRLVAQAFLPNPSGLPQVNHLNGIRTDNSVQNLEWESALGNVRHCYRTGLFQRKLTFTSAEDIRRCFAKGILSQAEIAHLYDVSAVNVSKIMSGIIFRPEVYLAHGAQQVR